MAAAVTTALALCALLASASARGRRSDECTIVTKGSVHGRPVWLPIIILPPGVLAKKVYIPAYEACKSDYPVGYRLMACDPDGPPPPKVYTNGWLLPYEAMISRTPPARSTGFVATTVYCSSPYDYAPPAGGAGGVRGAGGEGGAGGGHVEVRDLDAGGGGGGGGRWRGGVAVVPYV